MPVFAGGLARVDVERALYHAPDQRHFSIGVRITNLSGDSIGVDVRDGWQVVYPNQWGFSESRSRLLISETRLQHPRLDAAGEATLMQAFRSGQLTTIAPGAQLVYYREFNGSGRYDVDTQARGSHLIISLNGALRFTDGKTTEELNLDWDNSTAERSDLAIARPIPWKRIPPTAVIVPAR
jgi:hypothetical protein